jgi:uncharacterized protein (UPF0335 family)
MDTRKSEQATIEEWLKKHTLQDMEDIVAELSGRGEDVSDMSQVVHELEDIAEEEHEWEQEHGTKLKAEGETA